MSSVYHAPQELHGYTQAAQNLIDMFAFDPKVMSFVQEILWNPADEESIIDESELPLAVAKATLSVLREHGRLVLDGQDSASYQN